MAPAIPVEGSPIEEKSVFGNGFDISETKLRFDGRPFLSDVPPNVVLSSYSSVCPKSPLSDSSLASNGAFLGFDASTDESRHVASLGKLRGIRFNSIFRFKLWWSTAWAGERGSDLETETQIVILDTAGKAASEGCPDYPYLLILPIYEGRFRASIQAGKDDNVDVCVESGSTRVRESVFRTCVYLHAGHDPFLLVKDAVKAIRVHLGTFRHLEEKTPPAILDKFGWCTWDAFYLTVKPEGVWTGVKTLVDGGVPPRFLIIDDGWQYIGYDHEDPSEVDGSQQNVQEDRIWCRLTRLQENSKFGEYVAGTLTASPKLSLDEDSENQLCEKGRCHCVGDANKPVEAGNKGMGAFIRDMKSEYALLDDVYVWHALAGYWGGVRPGIPDSFNSRLVDTVLAPGLSETMVDLAVVKLATNTLGLVPPEHAHSFYEAFHSYLVKNGISGVKVDSIHVLEMVGEEYGGRMELAKAYYDAFDASIRKNFGGNRVIASMQHCNDFMLLGTEQISFGRVGDDFWTEDKNGDPVLWLQGVHMVHCAYNSLWMGQFIHPDWDMFQTKHPSAAFHAASRAISGGPIYVSDTPGQHDFDLLKRMVLPDGTIPLCIRSALPTIDCLFVDPLHDGATVLKIWNLNKYGGVVGAFNCQGGGWSRENRQNQPAPECRVPCFTIVSTTDVEWKYAPPSIQLEEVDAFVVYLSQADKMMKLKKGEGMKVKMEPLNYELYTMVPLQKVSESLEVGVVGLLNLFNSGGAVEGVGWEGGEETKVKVEVRGGGQLGAYASGRPKLCKVDGAGVDFSFDAADGRVVVEVPWKGGENSIVELIFST